MKIVVATDRSETARQAVAWAAEVRRRFDGQLVLLQVLASAEAGAEDRICADAESLDGARAVLMIDPDVVGAIVRAADSTTATEDNLNRLVHHERGRYSGAARKPLSIKHSGQDDGAFMEPSRRNRWQPVANGKAPKSA